MSDYQARWLLHPPDDRPFEDDPIRSVRISDEPDFGPFWDQGMHISNDYDELADWIGISRGLYERIIEWHEIYNANAVPEAASERSAWEAAKAARRRELTSDLCAEIGSQLPVLDEGSG